MSENSISSSELYKYPELISRSVDGYSFVPELVNAVNNFDFKKNAYLALSGTNVNEYSYIWSALSSIVGSSARYDSDLANTGIAYTENTPSLLHDNIARAFESGILNYIDNVSNVDVCKINALQSMIQQLGITYTVFDKVKLMPIQLRNLLDVLSIKKEYLVNSDKLQPLFALLLYAEVSSFDDVHSSILANASALTDCRLSSVISSDNEVYPLSNMLDKVDVSISSYINDDKLYAFTSAVYMNVLSDFCNLTYNNKLVKIYADISANILLSDFALYNTNEDKVNELNIYRLKYNIPKEFNESKEFDNIEDGISSYADYSIHELYLLSAEYDYRRLPLSASALYSRYYYYRQRAVRDFFKFVENEYADYLNLYLSTSQYNIDNTYLVVSNDIATLLLKTDQPTLSIDGSMIEYVAKVLADITTSVRDIREQIKTQAQRNFLKGTKQHIAYIIREYIHNNIYVTYLKIANSISSFDSSDKHSYETSDVVININEYADPTEYFNISTTVDLLSDNVNFRFWKQNSSTHAIAPFNSNNLFKKPDIIDSATAQSFTAADVQHMYKQNLQARFASNFVLSSNEYEEDLNKQLADFLDAVYDSGADTTYLDVSGNICCNLDFASLNELKHVKKISDLPLLRYEAAMSNLCALYSSLDTSLGLKDIVEEYSHDISGLSSITIGNYNSIMQKAKDVLVANGKTLDYLNIKDASTNTNDDDIAWRSYKDELFKKYTGLSIGLTSFYNIKNLRHASYLIHPYVKNFVDNNTFDFPIENIANIMSEKIMSLLVNDISYYVDDYGYLLNVWNSMLNTNSDYLSEYEKSSNKTPLGTTSKQIDYDGLFYPEAIRDFLANEEEFINGIVDVDSSNRCINKWYRDLNLSKYERDDIATQLRTLKNYIFAEATSPYDIYRYGKDFYGNAYILTKNYHDSSGSMSSNFAVDDATKLSTSGVIWMRLKNHPIAFPMLYKYKDIRTAKGSNEEKIALIKYINERKSNIYSNTKFNDLCCVVINEAMTTNELSAICINDFTISKDKTELFFLGIDTTIKDLNVYKPDNSKKATVEKSKLYVVHANIKKIYYPHPPLQKYEYFLILDNFNNNIAGIDTTPGFDLIPGNDVNDVSVDNNATDDEFNARVDEYKSKYKYKFNCFYNFNNYVGALAEYAEVSDSKLSCHVYMPYWNKTALDGNLLKEDLITTLECADCADNADEDYKLDITSTKRISIAYRNNLLENGLHKNVKDYLGKEFSYPPAEESLSSLNIIASSISTKDWKFDAKQFLDINESRHYMSYNDMGFVPVFNFSTNYINEIYSNDASHNKWFVDGLSCKGLLKINLVGPAAEKSGNDHGIFFKHVVPARLHEKYSNLLSNMNMLSVIGNISVANYFDARYTEMQDNKRLSSEMASIYDPYLFLQEIKNYDLSLRIDESYSSLFDKLNADGTAGYANIKVTKSYLDLFNDVPYLYWFSDGNYENCSELYNPGAAADQMKANNQDTYVIKLSTSDYLSVAWISQEDNMYGSNKGIKLDFNTAYYNSNPDKPKKNYFNWKHCFLNLDKPGDSGYLQIWHSDGAYPAMVPGNIYYIKNISDVKPRFLISLSGDFDLLIESDLLKLYANNEFDSSGSSYDNCQIVISANDAGSLAYYYGLTIDSISK